MEINKTVTSRKGNQFKVTLTLNGSSIMGYCVMNMSNEILFRGHGTNRNPKEDNYIVDSIKDIILLVEENYNNYHSMKSFEEWDGIIS